MTKENVTEVSKKANKLVNDIQSNITANDISNAAKIITDCSNIKDLPEDVIIGHINSFIMRPLNRINSFFEAVEQNQNSFFLFINVQVLQWTQMIGGLDFRHEKEYFDDSRFENFVVW